MSRLLRRSPLLHRDRRGGRRLGAVRSIYTCVDAKGRRLTADRPIAECLDREQRS